jgi:hypothetical protein
VVEFACFRLVEKSSFILTEGQKRRDSSVYTDEQADGRE